MKERFEGDSRANLIEALKRQEFVGSNPDLAEAIANRGKLIEYKNGDMIIVQDDEDNDIYLVVAGSVAVVINGIQVGTRKAGQHIGEMAAIEPAQKRSATNIALDTVVAVKLTSSDFNALGETYPKIWLPMARELSRRLLQRNELIP
jgi:CRP/FNR family transcriptional regulator, cyclic AMP receptor protein